MATSSRGALVGLLAFGAALLFLASSTAPAIAATGSISGTVTAAATGEGIAGIEVCTSPNGWTLEPGQEGNPFECATTAVDGTYTISDLLIPLEYFVQFGEPNGPEYFGQFYDDKSGIYEVPPADPVDVGSSPITGIDARLQSPTRIDGTVTAADSGLPVEGVEACAYRFGSGEYAACDLTAGDGSYSISVREAGEYEIEFAPKPTQGLALQFFDHQNRSDQAKILSVAMSETRTGIDAALAPGATISGRVTKALDDTALKNIRVCSIDAVEEQL